MVEIRCPHQPRSRVTKKRSAKRTSSKKRSAKQGIPNEVKTQVEDIVARFHATEIRDPRCRYVPRYRGKFLYLDREDDGHLHPICRLEYTGKMDDGSFAIYKYSNERYDDKKWFFPGSGYVDGTVAGAMRAENRSVPMNAMLTRTLEAVKIKSAGAVFCKEDGKPYRDFRTAFEGAVRRADIPDFTFHDLRHTFASRLVMKEVDLPTVKELMGHKHLNMTLRYTHLAHSHKKHAVSKLESYGTESHPFSQQGG